MSRAIVFDTPGLIDIRAFTLFGISAKPNSTNPIGYFGTGLKYAIATLVRTGAKPTVRIGLDEYTFFAKDEKFREQEYKHIYMHAQKFSLVRARNVQLAYATDYGKDWEIWQAFRELETNTRDEYGTTELVDDPSKVQSYNNRTKIIVEHEPFVQAYLSRDTIFLPEGKTVRDTTDEIQVLEGSTKFLYYRSMRARETQKPTLFTYNILRQVTLSEDRTITYEWDAKNAIASHVVKHKDRKFIERILTAPEGSFEHEIDFSYISAEPSAEFKEEYNKHKNRGQILNSSLMRYAGTWNISQEDKEEEGKLLFDRHPTPWSWNDIRDQFRDANNELVRLSDLTSEQMESLLDKING